MSLQQSSKLQQASVFHSPTRRAGLDQLESFLPNSGRHYASWRNSDLGPDDRSNVSVLSPWLRHRLVTETEAVKRSLEKQSFDAAEKFVQEVFWRAYFKGWLEQHPSVWRNYKQQIALLDNLLAEDQGLRCRYEMALEGRTGIDCFDHWAMELVETGYLHNHSRMWFASIWVFTLKLPWELGADFFLRHLMDGDPASNTLSWRWVAGLHTKGKTYLARSSNIEKFTNGRFNPAGQLSATAEPVPESVEHPLEPLDLPEPELSGRVGLLLTGEDCFPEHLFPELEPVSIFALTADTRGDRATGSCAETFTEGALSDAVNRSASHFSQDVVEGRDTETLCEWARDLGLETVVTAYVPIGPVGDRLNAAQASLVENGISIAKRIRDHDRVSWPHATKGYFKLKKQLPDILQELGI